jgi:hypothetical protein
MMQTVQKILSQSFDRSRRRQVTKQLIQSSVSPALWEANEQFVLALRSKLSQHPINTHPAIAALNHHRFNRVQLQQIHLEYRHAIVQIFHAIVQIFTDALLIAQIQKRQIEPASVLGSMTQARFLLTLNALDEFGFRPGINCDSYYQGNPSSDRYFLFEAVLDELGVSKAGRQEYVPSEIASRIRYYLEGAYDDFCSIVSLLAVAEKEFVLFSASLRRNAAAVGVNLNSGYYVGPDTDDNVEVKADANDDNHENDLWYVLLQALTSERYEDIEQSCLDYCDLWVRFWDTQMQLLESR